MATVTVSQQSSFTFAQGLRWSHANSHGFWSGLRSVHLRKRLRATQFHRSRRISKSLPSQTIACTARSVNFLFLTNIPGDERMTSHITIHNTKTSWRNISINNTELSQHCEFNFKRTYIDDHHFQQSFIHILPYTYCFLVFL